MRLFEILTAVVIKAILVSTALVGSRDEVRSLQFENRQTAAVIGSSDFLRRALHASTVCGNFVYIDGGAFSFTTGGSIKFEYATTILSIDLSTSWTNSTVTIQSTAKPSDVPVLFFGNLWCNESAGNLIMGFAGAGSWFGAPDPPPLSLWSFDPDNNGGGTWNEALGPDESGWSDLQRPVNGLISSGGGKGYVLGGSNSTNGNQLPGMVSIDLTTLAITNSSATDYSENGTAASGQMQYVPAFGPDGVFVILGGYQPPNLVVNLMSFEQITIFDPASGNYYNQTTTGNPPEPREQFCTTGVASSNGSYEIFMYAGWNGNLGPVAVPYDEIYILTLPAFVWIKVNYAPEHPRHDHTCQTVGNRQMLIIGGLDTTSETGSDNLLEDTFNTKDLFTQGLAIFDMTTLSFADSYDADAEAYEQSDSVQQVYAGSSKLPASWDNSGLEKLFQTTHFPNATSTTLPTNSTSFPSSSSSVTSKPATSNTGAIAGGVVGGFAAIAVVAGTVYFFLRRKRSSQGHEIDSTSNSQTLEMGNQGPGYSLVPAEMMHVSNLKQGNGRSEMDGATRMSEMGGSQVLPEMGGQEMCKGAAHQNGRVELP